MNNVFLVQSSFTVLFTVGQHSRSVKTQPSQTFELWCTFSFWLFMTWVIPPIDCCKEEVAICNFSLTLANFSIVLASCIFLQWQNSYSFYMWIQAFTLRKTTQNHVCTVYPLIFQHILSKQWQVRSYRWLISAPITFSNCFLFSADCFSTMEMDSSNFATVSFVLTFSFCKHIVTHTFIIISLWSKF